MFQFLAIKSAKLAKGKPFLILLFFTIITAVLSAILDNVTTVLLLVPVTLFIADELELDPFPFLISEVMASNIGGTATLIGDPPNIMIASKVHLTFMDFIYHTAPAVLFIFGFFLLTIKLLFGKKLHVKEEVRQKILAMDEYRLIKNYSQLKKHSVYWEWSSWDLSFMAYSLRTCNDCPFGRCCFAHYIEGRPSSCAEGIGMAYAFLFYRALYYCRGVIKVGLISNLSEGMILLTKPSAENMFVTAITTLWFSAISSAIVDNIPLLRA